ncbi:isoprenylcysteine carboxylmethyltransferase family protein [Mycolicibacterium boenickei]
MIRYLAALTLILFLVMVLTRVAMLRRRGIHAFHFGNLDKKDFLIPPFALFYFYTIFGAAFHWPLVSTRTFYSSGIAAWVGIALCLAGVVFVLLSLISFGQSFRVGIDVDAPDKLVTTGVFAISRNPIYVGFFLVLVGQFLVFPNWIPLAYLVAGTWLFHRQVLREESFLREHYGQEYTDYCSAVRRYL